MNDYWIERWRDGRIGFHEGAPNPWLLEHVGELGAGRVLVPLCGKSIDLALLAAHGFDVVGVELSPIAAEAFFSEAGLEPVRDGQRLSAKNITIVVADLFTLGRAELGTFDAFYDRAALVALAPDDRVRYAALVRSLLRVDARGLLVSYEHDGVATEPPYSVSAEEIARLWPTFAREEVGRFEVPSDRITKRGAKFAREHAYRLRAQ